MVRDKGPAAALAALLVSEREALLSGDLAALADLADRKQRLLAELDGAAVERPLLATILSRSKSNQSLIEAALRGVRKARERLEVARAGGATLDTYDARGNTASYSARRGLERRA